MITAIEDTENQSPGVELIEMKIGIQDEWKRNWRSIANKKMYENNF